MKNLLLLFLLISLVTACKKESKSSVISGGSLADGSDMRFDPYVEAFMDRLLLAGLAPDTSLLDIQFSNSLPKNVLGRCSKVDGVYETVYINQTLWRTLNAGSKEELIFHELGHCLLDRGHDTTLATDGTALPVSIMYPNHLGAHYTSAANYSAYQTELFSTNPAIFSGYLFDPVVYRSSLLSAGDSIVQQEHLTEERIFFCATGNI
jgi:hypothetical protein